MMNMIRSTVGAAVTKAGAIAPREWLRRWVWSSAAVVLTALSVVAPAHAHTGLVSSSPPSGASLSEPPREIEVEFTEPMTPSLAALILNVPGGQPMQLPVRSGARDTVLLAEIPPVDAEPGRWQVSYRVTSVDGHPIQGKIEFDVAASAAIAPVSPGPSAAASPTPTPSATGATESAAVDGGIGSDTGAGWRWAGPVLVAGAVVMLGAVILLGRRVRLNEAPEARTVPDEPITSAVPPPTPPDGPVS